MGRTDEPSIYSLISMVYPQLFMGYANSLLKQRSLKFQNGVKKLKGGVFIQNYHLFSFDK
jgi:hypothetical protein